MNSWKLWAAMLAWSAVQLTSGGGLRPPSVQIVTEDGSPLPNLPLSVVAVGHSPAPADDGAVRSLMVSSGTTQFAVEGLPPGYFLKSVEYGGSSFSPVSVAFDGTPAAKFVLTLGFVPVATLPTVTFRGNVLNIPTELKPTTLTLTSTLPGGPTVSALLEGDRSFAFSNIPIGAYRVGLRDGSGNESVSWTVAVLRESVSDLKINLRNNPFPEFERTSPPRSAFDGGKRIEITGVVTQKLTPIQPPSRAAYFRMEITDERAGVVMPFAVYVEKDWQVPNIHVGDKLTVPGILSTDGTNRLSAEPF